MSEKYVLDACALIAALTEEEGADIVADIFTGAINDPEEISIAMHSINILEVYYDTYKRLGEISANGFLEEMKRNPVEIV
ncbi:MAG: hypothetical protein LBR44_02785, partial [Clostridiales Family XIII bacterium]|nr:hypothetical protein [Clostridiales Family XIII bacterium]